MFFLPINKMLVLAPFASSIPTTAKIWRTSVPGDDITEGSEHAGQPSESADADYSHVASRC